MPGRSSASPPVRTVGIAVAAVAVVGSVALDWSFDGSDPVPLAVGAGAAVLAVGVTVLAGD